MNVNQLIKQINALISSHFSDFRGTYFFGSRSRGDNSEDSDYDILLTFGHKLHWKEKNLLYDLIAEIEIEKKIVIDLKAYQESEFKNLWTPFREKVIKEGVFYGAA
jgi:predicted nucleotidyltransferase